MKVMNKERLLILYKKTNGGHVLLSDEEYKEYANLRKEEYQERRSELIAQGFKNIRPVKDDVGDIIGWMWEDKKGIFDAGEGFL